MTAAVSNSSTSSIFGPPVPPGDTAAVVELPKRFIIWLAAVQGGALSFLDQFGETLIGSWGTPAMFASYAVVLAVPAAMHLVVRRSDDRLFRAWACILTAIVAVMAINAGYQWDAYGPLHGTDVTFRLMVSVALLCLVLVPFARCVVDARRVAFTHSAVFRHGFATIIVLGIAVCFVGACWAILLLCGALFAVIDLPFLLELFVRYVFVFPFTSIAFGVGVCLGRNQVGVVTTMRGLARAGSSALLPVVGGIAVVFLLTLPFTGLAPLWATASAAGLLTSLVAVVTLFTFGVFQDGASAVPYGRFARRVVVAALSVQPIFSAIAVYAVWLRVDQYGWTPERLWAAILVAIVGLYALALAHSALAHSALAWGGSASARDRDAWLRPLSRWNVALAVMVVTVIPIVNSPLFDPARIAAGDQAGRLAAAPDRSTIEDYEYVRFDLGRAGVEALRGVSGDAATSARVAIALASGSREELRRALGEKGGLASGSSPPIASDMFTVIPPDRVVDPTFLTTLNGSADASIINRCRRKAGACAITVHDLDRDGVPEHVLITADGEPDVRVYRRDGGGRWNMAAGDLGVWNRAGLRTAIDRLAKLRAEGGRDVDDEEVGAVRPAWDDLRIGDVVIPLESR